MFLLAAGIMASLNHTRFDVKWSLLGVTLYDPKDHDVHHRMPRQNYGQYVQIWDMLLGTRREYKEGDRIVKEDQLTERYEGVSKSSLGK